MESAQPILMLYLNEVHHVTSRADMEEIAANLPTFQSVRASLYQARRKQLPCMPRSRTDVHFEGEWAQTIDGKRFLQLEDGDDDNISTVIFVTDNNLELLHGRGRHCLCRWYFPHMPRGILLDF